MTAREEPVETPVGFEGEIAGLGLADVLQLNVQSRFSGSVSVRFGDLRGLVFMREGEIIHAEQGGLSGEEAFYEILAWPGGSFAMQTNVTAARRTIQRRWQYLLLEAHRLIDERRAGTRPPRPAPSSEPVEERLGRMTGVVGVVVLGSDGSLEAAHVPDPDELVGQVAFLSLFGKRLGDLFQAGTLRQASAVGARQHLLVAASPERTVGVLVNGTSTPGPVESELQAVAGNRP
jgi:predicted regulator of Ras-like GTPase activity (Roadblock/LC7/MglB family)